MNPLKKPIGGLLSNPFDNKEKAESKPLSNRMIDHKILTNQFSGSQIVHSIENKSNMSIPNSNMIYHSTPQDFQSNPSRVAFNNPLKTNFISSDERKHARFTKQRSIETPNSLFQHNGSMSSKNENIYENFKHIIYEIERKDAKIHNLESEIKNVKLAKDQKEIEQTKKALNESVKIFHLEEHRYNSLIQKNNSTKEEIESLKAEVTKKQPAAQRQQNYNKSASQLQNELNNTQSRLGELRGQYGNIVINDKIKIEQEFKKKMENQLFEITLNIAKENTNSEIQKIYEKLKGKKLAVSNSS